MNDKKVRKALRAFARATAHLTDEEVHAEVDAILAEERAELGKEVHVCPPCKLEHYVRWTFRPNVTVADPSLIVTGSVTYMDDPQFTRTLKQ